MQWSCLFAGGVFGVVFGVAAVFLGICVGIAIERHNDTRDYEEGA